MDHFRPPEPLSFTANVNEKWKRWRQELEFCLVATEKDSKEDKIKSSILLSSIGTKGREIYNTFTWADGKDKLEYKSILEKFEEYCTPRKNITYLRHAFFSIKQKDNTSTSTSNTST